ncbi:MAG TPA: hypothetical protein VNJ07_04045 [Chitinophagales bacterium]|nr:hypothetical protein [Chitinophagales bacterium]
MNANLSTLALTAILFATSSAQIPGSFDDDFDADGRVTVDFTANADEANCIVPFPDGNILVGGNAGANNMALVMLHPDGSLNNSFGTNGKVTLSVGTAGDEITSLALKPDGKILAAGDFNFDLVTLQFNDDGSLDSTFSFDGMVVTDINAEDYSSKILLQPDGKILHVGFSAGGIAGPYDVTIVRLNSDGTLDTGFDQDGKLVHTPLIYWGTGYEADAVLQPDGKIVVVGTYYFNNDNDIALTRILPDGTPDSTFGIASVSYYPSNTDDYGRALALLPSGKFLTAGETINGTQPEDIIVARFKNDGYPDTSFGTQGLVIIDIDNGRFDFCNDIMVQPDNKILLAGYTKDDELSFDSDMLLIRLHEDGSLDSTFGTNGIVKVSFGNERNQFKEIALQPDGKIVTSGFTRTGTNTIFAVSRFHSGVNVGIEEASSGALHAIIYPNPFTDQLKLEFTLPEDSPARLEIFSITGQRLATLFDGDVRAGDVMNMDYSPATTCDCMVIYRLQIEQGTYYGKGVMVK